MKPLYPLTRPAQAPHGNPLFRSGSGQNAANEACVIGNVLRVARITREIGRLVQIGAMVVEFLGERRSFGARRSSQRV